MGSRLDAAGADPGDHDDDQPDRNRPYRGEDVEKGLGPRSVRSFSNLNGYQPGNTVSGLEDRIIGTGCFLEKMPVCPGEGIYTSAGDTIPMPGSLYFSCSLADTGEHVPTDMDDW